MALLNAMVRCFNDGIGKIDMNRLARSSVVGYDIGAVNMNPIEAKKT
jgi:hypothetical protein